MKAPAQAEGLFGPERRALTIGLLIAIAAFAADGMGVVPALPVAVAALDGMALYGWSFSAFMLAWMVGTIAAGQLADARGPGRPMGLGLLGFGAGLLVSACAVGMGQFLVGRALQGLGGGAMIAAAYVTITRGYPDALRARMMAVVASVWILPAILGPAISGYVVEHASWRLVFAGVLPLLCIAAALVLPPLRPLSVSRPAEDLARIRDALRLAAGAGLGLVAPALRERSALLAATALLVGAWLFLPALDRLLPPGTARARRGLPSAIGARFLLAFAFYGAESFIPLLTLHLRGATPTQSGVALSTGALGWIAASWTQDRLEARVGARGRGRRVALGFALLLVGIALVTLALTTGAPLWIGFLGWALAGAGIGFAYGAGGLLCSALSPPGREGEVAGQLQVMEALGTSAGAGLGGALLPLVAAWFAHVPAAQTVVFVPPVLGALLGLGLSLRRGWEAPAG